MNKFLTIAKNTFIESIRQPFFAVIVFSSLFLFAFAPSITMFTMSDDNKLLRELGLSTLFLAGLFIAIFCASSAISEEIQSKTISTVLTKPVRRPLYIFSKFAGIAWAVLFAHIICTIALLFAIRHGVLETASDEPDYTVIVAAAIVISLSVILTFFLNYSYDWKFSSTLVTTLGFFSLIAIVLLCFIDRNLQFNPRHNGFHRFDIYASVLLLLAELLIAAVALALSCRFNLIATFSGCVGIFMLGLVNDYIFGRFAETKIWAKIGKYAVPNLQVFWISDAIYEGSTVPIKYIGISALYAVCYIAAVLMLAFAVFQKRQVG